MKSVIFTITFVLSFTLINAQNINGLSVKYEELTAPDFLEAVEKSGSTCIIPLGILEKHGPHLPLGTDMIDARELSLQAASGEYSIVFPPYYFGQIYEAKHQPGTIAYSNGLVWQLLQETCSELSRNGIKKIILVNGHGGNNNWLKYFCQAQLEKKKDYVVYLFSPSTDEETAAIVKEMRKTGWDGHAGETETSVMLYHHPELVKLNEAGSQSGKDLNRQSNLKNAFTGIWWYAKYPNHYAGDGSFAEKELGKVLFDAKLDQLIRMIKSVKEDTITLKLQNEFFEKAGYPSDTEQ